MEKLRFLVGRKAGVRVKRLRFLSGATYLVTMVSVCAWVSTLGWLFSCGNLQNFSDFIKFQRISKITKQKCVSGHSEQLDLAWYIFGPSWSPYCFISSSPFNFYILINLSLHLAKAQLWLNHRIMQGGGWAFLFNHTLEKAFKITALQIDLLSLADLNWTHHKRISRPL